MAYIATYVMTQLTSVKAGFNKPFNPLLHETYTKEIAPGVHFVAEQVSHHPPITAWHCHSDDFTIWSQFETGNRFTGKALCFYQKHPTFVILHRNETPRRVYVVKTPILSAHNLIIGQPYLDIGECAYVTSVDAEHQYEYKIQF